MDRNDGPTKRWFSVWFVVYLFLTALMCLGCYFAGHRRGFRDGEIEQLKNDQSRLAFAPATLVSYDVSDIYEWNLDKLGGPPVSRPYTAGIIDMIQREFPGLKWGGRGETPRIVWANKSIEVTANDYIHMRVTTILDTWRKEHLPPDYQKTTREYDVSGLLPSIPPERDQVQRERADSDFQTLITAVEQFVRPKIGDKLRPGKDLNANTSANSLNIKAKEETHQQVTDVLKILRAIKFGEPPEK